MRRTPPPAESLAETLGRPQRVGVFGHRGVGKTTLLAMLYREAVGGRLPGLRLAAADVRTAEYLADKVTQLEQGRPVPGTLAEAELRLRLYRGDAQIDLLFKDYQGEHVELGREESIHDFFRDCDALWICHDAATLTTPEARLRRQQEVEQLIEGYLAAAPQRTLHRPVALLITRADLCAGEDPATSDAFAMTRHALKTHCPASATFAVSSLGGPLQPGTPPRPAHLDAPLAWLADALRAQDRLRVEQLTRTAGVPLSVRERAVQTFARRYPSDEALAGFRARLGKLRQRRTVRSGLTGFAVVAAVLLGFGTYDAVGRQQVLGFARDHADDPTAVLEQWESFQRWHPTRHLLNPAAARAEQDRLSSLADAVRSQQLAADLAGLQRRAADPEADATSAWQAFLAFRTAFPETTGRADVEKLRERLLSRRDAALTREAGRVLDELQHVTDPAVVVERANAFLVAHTDAPQAAAVRELRDACALRVEERAIDAARVYSALHPLNFHTRREHYQRYLDQYPQGRFHESAHSALAVIADEWDRNDFRQVRDQWVNNPADVDELVARCRSYLAAHPDGRFRTSAAELLRWTERVTTAGDYKVMVTGAQIERRLARWVSWGPDLSVEIEVGGVRYGPSPVVVNRYDPEWNYEFPRLVRWKMGDPVIIRVFDHDWGKRPVVEIYSADGDPLAMRLLAGDAYCGANRVSFTSDFVMPELPAIE